MFDKEFISSISDKSDAKKKTVKRVLKALTETLAEKLKENGECELKGLGTFRVSQIKDTSVKNKYSDTATFIPVFNRVYFTADKELKRKINRTDLE